MSEELHRLCGPAIDSADGIALGAQFGFSFRSLLGELMYAYVVGRLDIGYAVTLMDQAATHPSKGHYCGLKRIALYLRSCPDLGIQYWRQHPRTDLPPELPWVAAQSFSDDASLPPFPVSGPLQLVVFVDAAHATHIPTRRSVTGMAFMLCGGAIVFRTKLQSCVATSSTEAEFYAAVLAAKAAKYLRSVLAELGVPQDGPTPLYEYNLACIALINARKPTERSCHIDV